MLPGKPEQHLKELNDLATQLATKSPGVISFIDLLSPVSNTYYSIRDSITKWSLYALHLG